MQIRSIRALAALVAILTLSLDAAVFAQALPNLASARVQYNTRKNTVKPGGELKAQIDQIDKELVDATRLGRTGEVRRLLAKGMALLGGRPWTDVDEFEASLVIRTDRLAVDSSMPYRVRLEQIFAPQIELTRPLRARAVLRPRLTAAPATGRGSGGAGGVPDARTLRGGVPLAPPSGDAARGVGSGAALAAPVSAPANLGTFEGAARDLRESPFPLELNVAAAPDGVYTLAIEVLDQDRLLGTATLTVAMHKGLDARLRALENAASKAPPALQADLRYPADYIRKVNEGFVGFGTFNVATELGAAEALALAVKSRKNPFAGRTGDFERHYLLEPAGEIMPYRVYVPPSYTRERPAPLIVALHGLGATEDSFFDGYAGRLPALAEERGYIVAAPLGYRVDGFYGASVGSATEPGAKRRAELSELDVMDVLRRMRADYNIDQSRIYLMGHSMGGIGTWAIAAKYPGIWAAIAPFAGFAPPASAEQLRHIPQFVVHGDADATVSVNGSRVMVAELKKLGGTVTYIEVPGGSHTGVVAPNLAGMFDFFDAHKKPATSSQE